MDNIILVWSWRTSDGDNSENSILPRATSTDPWSWFDIKRREAVQDLGSVNAPPPLEHRQSGVGWSKLPPREWKSKILTCTGSKKDIMKRIKNNDLTHYFLSDHRQLPASYLASCQKFFKSLSCKPQAPSSGGHKLQASSLTATGPCVINRIIKDKLWIQKKHLK